MFLEISRVQNGGRPPGRENRLLDVYNEKPVRVSARILVPVKEHPRVSIGFTFYLFIETGLNISQIIKNV